MSAKVFFSSCFTDPEGERLALRDQVMALNPAFDRNDSTAVANLPVWLAENHPKLDVTAPTLPFEKAMLCVDGVRDADAYVAVVRTRHGTGVDLSPMDRVQASYFELELFEAALLRKPSYIFLMKGAEPSARIEKLLRLLAPALPGLCWQPLEEGEILRRVETILARQMHPKLFQHLRRARASGKRMADQLTGARHKPYEPMQSAPAIQFLGGMVDTTARPTSEALVASILEQAQGELNQHTKLTLLWIAIRELMGTPPTDPSSSKFLPLWDSTLSAWNSAAAWFGLHGHPLMGCLAALGSLTRIREQASGLVDAPHGAMASEYYSIAKQLGLPILRRSVLATSRRHIDAAFLKGDTSGNYAMRGSIRRAQGDNLGGIEDYKHVVELREGVENASSAAIGEAKSELGFALVFAGERHRGIACMEEGIALFESDRPSGFFVRAKRKLGRAYIRAGAPRQALSTLAEAHEMATKYGMMDQISRIDRLASKIDSMFRRARL